MSEHLAVVHPNSVQKLSFIAKGMPSRRPRAALAPKRLSAASAARLAASSQISLKQPCIDVFAASMAAAVREWLEHSDERRSVARECSEADTRDGGIL